MILPSDEDYKTLCFVFDAAKVGRFFQTTKYLHHFIFASHVTFS